MWPFTELRQQRELVAAYQGLIAAQAEHIEFMNRVYSIPDQQRRKIAEGRVMLDGILASRTDRLEGQGIDSTMAVVTVLGDDPMLATALNLADRLEAQGDLDPLDLAAFHALTDLLRPAEDKLGDAVNRIFH